MLLVEVDYNQNIIYKEEEEKTNAFIIWIILFQI